MSQDDDVLTLAREAAGDGGDPKALIKLIGAIARQGAPPSVAFRPPERRGHPLRALAGGSASYEFVSDMVLFQASQVVVQPYSQARVDLSCPLNEGYRGYYEAAGISLCASNAHHPQGETMVEFYFRSIDQVRSWPFGMLEPRVSVSLGLPRWPGMWLLESILLPPATSITCTVKSAVPHPFTISNVLVHGWHYNEAWPTRRSRELWETGMSGPQ